MDVAATILVPVTYPMPGQGRLMLMQVGAALLYRAEVFMPLGPLPWILLTFDGAVRWILAFAVPIAIAVVWRLGLSPRARFRWPDTLRWTLQVIVLLLGPVTLFAVGWVGLAWGVSITTVIGAVAVRIWEPPRRADST